MKIHKAPIYILVLIGLISLLSFPCIAQDTTKYVTFMGFVSDANSRPVPGAVLRNETRNKAVATELSGRFLMVVAPGDIIHIKYIGFKEIRFAIPTKIEDNKYVKNITMQVDTFMLGTVNVKAYPTAEEMFKEDLNLREVSEYAGFNRLDHAPVIKAPNPLTSPISAIGNAVQKNKMKNNKGGIDAYHQTMMIKEFYNEGATAVPDSIRNLYNK